MLCAMTKWFSDVFMEDLSPLFFYHSRVFSEDDLGGTQVYGIIKAGKIDEHAHPWIQCIPWKTTHLKSIFPNKSRQILNLQNGTQRLCVSAY
jgi:hypothetical protein